MEHLINILIFTQDLERPPNEPPNLSLYFQTKILSKALILCCNVEPDEECCVVDKPTSSKARTARPRCYIARSRLLPKVHTTPEFKRALVEIGLKSIEKVAKNRKTNGRSKEHQNGQDFLCITKIHKNSFKKKQENIFQMQN